MADRKWWNAGTVLGCNKPMPKKDACAALSAMGTTPALRRSRIRRNARIQSAAISGIDLPAPAIWRLTGRPYSIEIDRHLIAASAPFPLASPPFTVAVPCETIRRDFSLAVL